MRTNRGLERTLRLLTRTPNPAAIDALDAGLRSDEPLVRTASARALAQRKGVSAARTLLLALAETPPDVQESIAAPEIARRLRPGVLAAVQGDDLLLCKRACRYAHTACDFYVLPVLVEQASIPSHAYGIGLATTALHLAKELSDVIYRPAGASPAAEDPAFARRAAINSLIRAVDAYASHQHLELIEAFLLLVTPEDLVLKRVLEDATHAAHAPMIEALRCCTAAGAMHILASALLQEHPPAPLRTLLMDRCDRPFVEHLLSEMGDRPPLRALEQARRLARFSWAELGHEPLLLSLDGALQANALRLAAATGISKRRVATLAELMLKSGRPEARVAACHVLGDLKARSAAGLISSALRDPEPAVVAAAAAQLRRCGIEGSTEKLVALLDHEHDRVRQSAQHGLSELTFARFRAEFDALGEHERVTRGRLVAKADPGCVDAVRAEARAASVRQRIRALEIAAALGIADALAAELTHQLGDKDPAVRAAAARALCGVTDDRARHALRERLDDTSRTVREAAQAALGPVAPITLASNLIEGLRQEFPS